MIVVEPCSDVKIKQQLEKIIVKHGGTVEQNVRRGRTSIYVQTTGSLKAKNVVKQGIVDVVKSSWMLNFDQTFRKPIQETERCNEKLIFSLLAISLLA